MLKRNCIIPCSLADIWHFC